MILSFNLDATSLRSQGISGIRTASAQTAMPAWSASQPDCVSQDLHHRDLAGRLGRLTGPVEHLDGEAERAVEAEGDRRGGDVVLDRPGHADRVEPLAVELVEDAQSAAPDDGDQRIDLSAFSRPGVVGHVDFLDHLVFVDPADVKRIDPGRLAQETAAGRIEVLDQLGAERHQPAVGIALRVQQPVEPVPDADHLPSHLARRQAAPLTTAFIPGT